MPPSNDPQAPTPANKTLFQTFEWHTPSTPPSPNETHSPTSHYARILRILPFLSDSGITALWLPPGCKANNPQGNGYDCYDLWDLGEFDQKYARSTRWGSREEVRDLITAAHARGVEMIWDAVLNHKTAGDATEDCWAVEVDETDRRVETCPPKKIEAWIRYHFPGRGDTYSALKWRAEHFNGTDWDQRAQRHAIYKLIDDPATYPRPDAHQQTSATPETRTGWNRLLRFGRRPSGIPPRRPGKGWADDVDDTHGNYDYLVFSNIDYTHPAVREDVCRWGEWMVDSTQVDGFRLDAVQHFSSSFTREWIRRVNAASIRKNGREAFVVGEIWTDEVKRILRWLDAVGQNAWAFDSPLLYNFSCLSMAMTNDSRFADLRSLTRNSLVECRPFAALTVVTNHDTQPGQTSYTPMDARLKTLFYAFILLRSEGYPSVFWGDLFGTQGPHAEPPACSSLDGRRNLLPDLILARKLFAYGPQKDYFNHPACIAWVRAGTHDRPGCVVLICVFPPSQRASKKIAAGLPGDVWVDVLGDGGKAPVVVDGNGKAEFVCRGMSAAVYVRQGTDDIKKFPVAFDVSIAQ